MANITPIVFCILAQALFVLRARAGAEYFGDAGALALTAVAALAGGGVIVAARYRELSAQLNLKTFALAALAAALGIALHTSLELAGRAAAGAGAMALMAYSSPVLLLLLSAALKWEPLDKFRLAALILGPAAIAWLIAGPGVLQELAASPRGFVLLLLGAMAMAAFLAAAHKLVTSSSVAFAAAAVLVIGGAMTAWMAGAGAARDVGVELATGGLPTVLIAITLVIGTALAYVLLFAGLQRLKASTVGASYLTVAPWSALYLVLVQGVSLTQMAVAGALAALAAFASVALRPEA